MQLYALQDDHCLSKLVATAALSGVPVTVTCPVTAETVKSLHRNTVTGQGQGKGQRRRQVPAQPSPEDVARQEDEAVHGIHMQLWETPQRGYRAHDGVEHSGRY